MNHDREVSAEFFEACCQPSHVCHRAEKALDDVAYSIETGVVWDGLAGIALRRDDRQRRLTGDELTDGRGRCMDNIFFERLWRSHNYESAYLH